MLHQPQRAIDILEHADGIGKHDVVERALDTIKRLRIFHVAEDENQFRMPGVRLGNRRGAEIDADAIGRFQAGEQVATAAAQFQHPFAGRNQKLHEFEVVLMVGGVELAPAIELIAIGLEMFEQIALALAGELQRSSGIGLLQIHCSLGVKNGEFS
jgi:hypothetical protein